MKIDKYVKDLSKRLDSRFPDIGNGNNDDNDGGGGIVKEDNYYLERRLEPPRFAYYKAARRVIIENNNNKKPDDKGELITRIKAVESYRKGQAFSIESNKRM